MGEIWKPVSGYESKYQVSNLGEIYSNKAKKYLNSYKSASGHLCVRLSKDGEWKEKQVKRLVAEAFIGQVNGRVVIHKDGNSNNNCVDNLEIITQAELNKRKNTIIDKENHIRYLNKYKVIYKPDHFHHVLGKYYEGWVYEHRYVMESFLGRPLSSDEIVHHKDGDIYNNDISNLQLVTRSEHQAIHMLERGFKPTYCIDCGKKITTGAKRCAECQIIYSKRNQPDKYELYEEVKASTYTAVAKKYGVSDVTIMNWLGDLYKSKKRRKQQSLLDM